MHHARIGGDRSREARAASSLAQALGLGPTSVTDAVARLEEILTDGLSNGRAEAMVLLQLGQLLAMAARFDEARSACKRACRLIADRGGGVLGDATSIAGPARVELLANRPDAAEELLRRDHDALTARNERYYRPIVAGMWAHALYELGRFEEAGAAASTAEELAADDDVEAQALWRSVRGKLLARSGKPAEGLVFAERAVEILGETDATVMQADALLDLAMVHALRGAQDEAVAAAVGARMRYSLKEHIVGVHRAEASLETLGEGEARAAPPKTGAAQSPT
jgi:tetratricopeptide (TPR) repeat protein